MGKVALSFWKKMYPCKALLVKDLGAWYFY